VHKADSVQIDETNLAAVSADDLAIIKAARVTAEAAETDAGGFNDAIDAAGGTSSTAGKALQVGKIKNKVLKLQLEVLALQIDQAQSGKDNSDKIAAEQKKLDNNISTDTASAGETSQSVDFQGDDSP
jgi:preprotein translocase subunit SecF